VQGGGPTGARARLAFLRDYRLPYRAAAARAGAWRAAPASWSFLALVLLVSLAWRLPGAHGAVAACCAYRAGDLHAWPHAARVAGSAFLVVRPIEAAWSVVATWLLLAPLEAMIGTRRMLLVGALGNLVPSVSVGLAFRAAHPDTPAPLDVGTSAVVVAAGAVLVVWTRSLPIAALYLLGVAVDVLVSPDLATAEHLLALATGAALALVLRRGHPSLSAHRLSRKAHHGGPKSLNNYEK
jgi:hypothetical protein